MSANLIILDRFKPWLNARVNDLCVDGDFKADLPAGSIPISSLQSSGAPPLFLHDNGVTVEKKEILLPDLQGIGLLAPDNTFLHHSAGTVSFIPAPADESIYSQNGVLASNRVVDGDNLRDLSFIDIPTLSIAPTGGIGAEGATAQFSHVNFGGSGNPGVGMSIQKDDDAYFLSAGNHVGAGINQTMIGHSNQVSGNFSFMSCDGDKLNLISNGGGNTAELKVDAIANEIRLKTDNIILETALVDTPAASKIVCRDLAGKLVERDVSSLTAALPGFNKAASLTFTGPTGPETRNMTYNLICLGDYNDGGLLSLPSGLITLTPGKYSISLDLRISQGPTADITSFSCHLRDVATSDLYNIIETDSNPNNSDSSFNAGSIIKVASTITLQPEFILSNAVVGGSAIVTSCLGISQIL